MSGAFINRGDLHIPQILLNRIITAIPGSSQTLQCVVDAEEGLFRRIRLVYGSQNLDQSELSGGFVVASGNFDFIDSIQLLAG